MSYEFYKTIHLISLFLMVYSTGALVVGSDRVSRKTMAAMQGIGWLGAFVAGFGLMARRSFSFTSGWVIAKVLIIFGFIALMVISKRKPELSSTLFIVAPLLFIIAILLVLFKPF